MRLYISIIAVTALTTTACGKKAEPVKPTPAKTEEPAKVEAKVEPKVEEPAKVEPKVEEPAKVEPTAVVAVDRTEAVQKGLESWAAGKFDETYANFTDDAVLYNVGSPEGAEIKGKQGIIDFAKKMTEGMTDMKAKAGRVISAGDVQIVEAVMTANVKTKGADGAEVVKAVAVPVGMVFAFNAEGKVTTQWSFMDQSSMLQQIGAIPGLPEGFVAATLPETTEIIKGEANPAHAALNKAFGEKFKVDTIDAAVTEHMADDYAMTDFHSGKKLGKADTAAFLKGMMGMFADETMTNDKEFSVGEYFVTVTTSNSTYKGGMGGTADTKVSTHSLTVSRIVDGKFKSWAGYMNGLELAQQIGLMGGAAEKPVVAAAEGSTGVAACDLYITKMTECLGKVADASIKTAAEMAMNGVREGWKTTLTAAADDATKATIADSCKKLVEGAKASNGQLCPDVKWE